MSDQRIYLDWAATTPLRPEVVKLINELAPVFGNPSSRHAFGQEAREHIDQAREKIAGLLGAKPEEIYFTAGATESCNLALKGATFYALRRWKGPGKPHIVTSAIEHHAVLEPLRWLEKMGFAEVTEVEPDRHGIVAAERILDAVSENTILVSLMLVNNEVGTIQPVADVARALREANENRQRPVLLHTDATQAIPYLPVTADALGVDMLSLSGHKFGAPKGVGLLYRRKGVRIDPVIHGGAHERRLRAGTENCLGIMAMAEALAITVGEREAEAQRVGELRGDFEARVLDSVPNVEVNGHPTLRSPHISNLYFADIEAEALLVALDVMGVAASAGSACTSEELGSSHVLMSMFHDQRRADGSVRFSFGWLTTEEHLNAAIEVLRSHVERLRFIAGRV